MMISKATIWVQIITEIQSYSEHKLSIDIKNRFNDKSISIIYLVCEQWTSC